MFFRRIFLAAFILLQAAISVFAQPATAVFTELQLAYKRGVEFYDRGLYSQSRDEFKKLLAQQNPQNEPNFGMLRTDAEMYDARCAIRLGLPEGEQLILDFIRNHAPEPVAGSAVLDVANYYYRSGKFEKALEYYRLAENGNLSAEQRTEVRFKTGYAYFIQKKFGQAKAAFGGIKEKEGDYYYPSNYYHAVCCFYENDFNGAIKGFERCGASKLYGSSVPYYVTQIYFLQNKFDKVIEYAEPKLSGDIRNKPEMSQLVGQSYFEKKDYQKALPLLEYYANSTNNLRPDEHYQVGFVQYKNEKYQKAVTHFEAASSLNTVVGQNANYYLGDCYLRLGNKTSARNAFGGASRLDFDKSTQSEALLNYGKLSYEQKYDREAIAALQKIKSSSPQYAEAQSVLSYLFLSTRDYDKALQIMDELPNQSSKIRETYQKVAYLKGVQLYNEGKNDEARSYFTKSLDRSIDPKTTALASFWMGDLANSRKDYETSRNYMTKFLSYAKNNDDELPAEASLNTGNYLQGYNYLKQKNYSGARGYFQDAVTGIKSDGNTLKNNYVKNQILGDATLRAGDCLFKQNNYDAAVKYYDDAIQSKTTGYVYAIYQKAIIQGLRGDGDSKIILLEKITKDFPNSEYADDALLELGSTYQENGKLKEATIPLKALVNGYKGKSPLITQALLKLGLISYNQGVLETAINYYKQVFTNNPEAEEAKDALSALEEIYVKDLNKPDDYFAFVETVPGYKVSSGEKDNLNFKAAESQFELGNYEKASQGYTDYLTKYPSGTNRLLAYFRRGECFASQKQYSKALVDYENVIQKGAGSKYYEKSLNKAALIAYNSDKDFNKSFDYYTKLEKVASNDDARFEAQLGALRSAYRTNNSKSVVELAEKVAKNQQASQEQQASANFYLGKVAFDKKEYDRALTAFNQVTKLSDNEQTAEARYLVANIYFLRRDYDVAEKLCANASKESGNYEIWVAKSTILQSDIYAEKGDFFNARAALEAVLETYTSDKEITSLTKTKLSQLDAREKGRKVSKPDGNGLLEMDNGGN